MSKLNDTVNRTLGFIAEYRNIIDFDADGMYVNVRGLRHNLKPIDEWDQDTDYSDDFRAMTQYYGTKWSNDLDALTEFTVFRITGLNEEAAYAVVECLVVQLMEVAS